MITKLRLGDVDIVLKLLSTTRTERWAAQVLRRYRRQQSVATERAAVAALNRLSESKLAEIKAAVGSS